MGCRDNMIKANSRIKKLVEKILGIKLVYKMFLIYILGGFLPLVLIGFYLMQGTNQILVQKAKSEEMQELDTVKNQIVELQSTLMSVSRYFYFDAKLEEIAEKEYIDYQDLVDDYKGYTNFQDYRVFYNNLISSISIYLENETIKGNSTFVKVDDAIRSEEWYQRISGENGVVIWEYLPSATNGKNPELSLIRMIKTRRGQNVGALVIHVRTERLEGYISGHRSDTFIVLDGDKLICSAGEQVAFEDIKEYLPAKEEDSFQEQITLDGEPYILTCETILPQNSSDFIQIVGVRAYRDILKEANQQSRKSMILSVIWACFAVVMILSFSVYFSYRIERFKEQMRKASEGNFELEEKLGGSDEISQLYDYLNAMIQDIQRLLSEVYREKIHAEQLKTSQKDAELRLLTSQVNPHFLYNTLETIRMKARVSHQYEIEDLVKMLGKLLRSSIQAGEKEVPVKSEIELVESYLKIQQYRFGERIFYEIRLEEDVENDMIVPLILQPLVENSIIHGFEGREEKGIIRITVKSQEEDIVFLVEDNGNGIEEEELEKIRKELQHNRFRGQHIGICNVNQRIRLKYGDGYGVSLDSRQGEGTVVEIRLPSGRAQE